MPTVRVSPANVDLFVDYCHRFAKAHDDSFLPDESFSSNEEYPAYLLLADENVIGAACLIRNRQFLDAKKGRLMIFHSTQTSRAAYLPLLQVILPHTDGLDFIYLFVPEERTDTRQIWEQLGFFVERYSYVLKREAASPTEVNLPAGFHLRAVTKARHEQIAHFTDLLNLNCPNSAGHVKATRVQIMDDSHDPLYLPGGLKLLYHDDTPIGTIHICKDGDEDQAASIEKLSVHPAFRNRGLGRALLKDGINFALSNGLRVVYLSVTEGFVKASVMICYRMDVERGNKKR
jgi:mycothiol synthase